MPSKSQKTEHSGPKRGRGAYWGRKRDAKRISNRLRREKGKRDARIALDERGS